VWDSGLLRSRALDWRTYARQLDARGPVALPPPAGAPYAAWATESCRLSGDIYPAGHAAGAAYVTAQLPLAERRLRMAGQRLAALLNRTLR
jgi:hypothetical protein